MNPTRFTHIAVSVAMLMLLGPAVTFAATDAGAKSTWQEVLELVQGEGAGAPPLLPNGQAVVNVATGLISFEVNSLPVMTGPSGQMVKGTLVCRVSQGADATLVDTPTIPVAENGKVLFSGYVQLPVECQSAPSDVAFFIRTTQEPPQEL